MNLPVNAARAGRLNRVHLLETVQRAGAISRADLVRSTGLQPATVSRAVRDLLERRLLHETGRPTPRRRATAGAPSYLLELDREWHRVLAVHQGVTVSRLGVVGLDGAIVARSEVPRLPSESPRAAVHRLAEGLRELVLRERLTRDRIRGVGVGAVGLVDPASGVVRAAPNLGWTRVPLRSWLEEELDLPVTAANNVHGMAAGELRFTGVPERCALYVYLGIGVGAAVLYDGRVLDGAHGAAGELGHVLVPGGGPCTCGKTGCLETVLSERVLAGRAAALSGEDAEDTGRAVRRLLELAATGDAPAGSVVSGAVAALAHAVAQATEVLDPGAVIVEGELARSPALVLEPLAAALRASAFAARGRSVTIRSGGGADAGMAGAAALALQAFLFNPEGELRHDRPPPTQFAESAG